MLSEAIYERGFVMDQSSAFPTRADLEKYRKNNNDGFLHVLLFYILPFIIFNLIVFFCVTASPKVSLEVPDTEDYLTAQAIITVETRFPVKSLTADLDGEELTLNSTGNRTYTTTVTKNGVLEVTITNLNGMTTAQFEHIDILDDNPPSIENAYVENGIVTLTISDSQSGVNFESVYALDSSDQKIEPLTADQETNTFSFAMDPDGLHVHAQDRAGNEVQGTFTSHLEGDEETLDSDIEGEDDSADDNTAD